jgi:uncharacterized membrane protein YedE/YeeE
MKLRVILLGIVFGFVLSRVGATDYDAIHGMFMFTDLRLAGVIGTAVALSALGFAFVRRRRARTLHGDPIFLTQKQMTPYLVPGALIFGVGWALSGTCPGTSLAQVGEGHWGGLAIFVGIVVGGCLARPRTAPTAPSLSVLSRP